MLIAVFIVMFGGFIGITESSKSEARKETEQETVTKYCHGPVISPNCPAKERERVARNQEFKRTHPEWDVTH